MRSWSPRFTVEEVLLQLVPVLRGEYFQNLEDCRASFELQGFLSNPRYFASSCEELHCHFQDEKFPLPKFASDGPIGYL